MRYDADSGLHIDNWHDTAEQRLKMLAELGLDGTPTPSSTDSRPRCPQRSPPNSEQRGKGCTRW